jgi:glycosyltransferase involved in cell wall biosynthesis
MMMDSEDIEIPDATSERPAEPVPGKLTDPTLVGPATLTAPVPTSPANPVALSVVIATYNRLDSLLWLLDDLERQAGVKGGFEVLVVDDGGSVPVAEEVSARPRSYPIRVIRRKNGGPGVARDQGINEATGDIIVIVDDDMVVDVGFLAAHQSGHASADVVLGHIRGPRDSDKMPLFERFHQDSLDRFVSQYQQGRIGVEGTRLCTGNVSFSRAAYLAVGGFDLGLNRCEDRDLGIRFERAGYRFAFQSDAFSDHRSDHRDVATWRKRSALYGELDSRIADKHPDFPKVSPWAFLPLLPLVARPVVVLSALIEPFGRVVADLAYRLGCELDRRGRRKLAITAASLTYGTDYFRGVGIAQRSRRGFLGVVQSLGESRKSLKNLQEGRP